MPWSSLRRRIFHNQYVILIVHDQDRGTKTMKNKKKMEIPHSLVIIVIVMLLATALTYIVPAGEYARIKNDSGQTMVDPATFQYVAQNPVNPLRIFSYIFPGLSKSSGIIFSLMCSGGGLGIVLATNALQGAAGTLSRKVKGKEWVVVTLIMAIFALICIPAGFNSWIPFATVGLVMAKALGYDEIVGVSMIMLGGAVGFACGAMNLSNTGTAQAIAELPIFSGMGYRLFCMIPFFIVTVIYVVRYAEKVKKDPTKSYVHGLDLGSDQITADNIPTFEKRHIPVAIVLVICLAYMMYLGILGKITLEVSGTLFIYMGILAGIANRMRPNDMCKEFVKGAKGMAGTAMMIGFAYGITLILNKGGIMDTIVYNLAKILNYVPAILQAPVMFFMHVVINFFVTSGSGQAATTMPIMIPVADLVGMSRQTAVLAFNFGDGFCNFILPHAAATMGFVGAGNIPFTRWFRFAIKLFGIWCIVGSVLLMIATVIGY